MRSSGTKRQSLIKTSRSTWAATLSAAGSTLAGWMGSVSLQWTIPAPRRTITSTCWLAFSAPVQVNDDNNPSKWHWFGTFSVAPNGRLDAVWYDNRNAANFDSQLFYSYSTDAGVTWSANVPVSNSFNPQEGWPNQNKIGDYITIVSDETGGNVAYAATFNFNPNRGQHEQDVYYVRVCPDPPCAQPTPGPSAVPCGSASP